MLPCRRNAVKRVTGQQQWKPRKRQVALSASVFTILHSFAVFFLFFSSGFSLPANTPDGASQETLHRFGKNAKRKMLLKVTLEAECEAKVGEGRRLGQVEWGSVKQRGTFGPCIIVSSVWS